MKAAFWNTRTLAMSQPLRPSTPTDESRRKAGQYLERVDRAKRASDLDLESTRPSILTRLEMWICGSLMPSRCEHVSGDYGRCRSESGHQGCHVYGGK